MEEATHPVYHSSEHSAIRSNRLESDTVKPVDFDGVGNAICNVRILHGSIGYYFQIVLKVN